MLPYAAFDADNHYYEAEDAFTRHVDPKMHKRCMQWAQIDGRQRLLVGVERCVGKHRTHDSIVDAVFIAPRIESRVASK